MHVLFFIYSQAYVTLCFSLMYETEDDEKHLDFVAANQPMVSIVITVFRSIFMLCSWARQFTLKMPLSSV